MTLKSMADILYRLGLKFYRCCEYSLKRKNQSQNFISRNSCIIRRTPKSCTIHKKLLNTFILVKCMAKYMREMFSKNSKRVQVFKITTT